MPRRSLELPQLQNWSCHTCGGCCKQHGIYITPAEKARIEAQGWGPADGIPAGQPLFVQMPGTGRGEPWFRLAHREDGSCVFLNEAGLCRIHGKFGEPAKPLACRVYPYAFHPTIGGGLTLSLRFSCPSVAANKGTPIREQREELEQLAQLVVPARLGEVPPPKLSESQSLSWKDTLQVVDALDATLAQPAVSIPLRLLQGLHWLSLLAQAKLASFQGTRLTELLQLLLNEAATVLPELPAPQRPSLLARIQFRLLAGQYARKDTYGSVAPGWRDRWKMLGWGLSFAWGGGQAPAVQSCFRPVPFAELEQPLEYPDDVADELFERFMRVKVQGLHFCGPAYYHENVVHGFSSLALVYPVTLWLARWLALSRGASRVSEVELLEALTIADHHHGYSPALGTWGFRSRVRILQSTGQLGPLILWNARQPDVARE